MAENLGKRFYVLVATPLGLKGKGGIDRLMDVVHGELKLRAPQNFSVSFVATRGDFGVFLSPFFLIMFLMRMIFNWMIGRLDVVHLNVAQDGSFTRKMLIGRVCGILRVPYVIHLHGSSFDVFVQSLNNGRKLRVEAFFDKATCVLVLGQYWKGVVQDFSAQISKKIVVIPNATVPAHLAKQSAVDDKVRILFLGMIGKRKGVPQLVDALHQIHDLKNWKAILAGSGEVLTTQKQIDDLGMTNRISLPGWVSSEDVKRLLANADILVLPSLAENLPMSVIEGMAAGLAVVATPVGAVEDIIQDGVTGLLVSPGDSVALAAALKKLIDDPVWCRQLGNAAQKFHRENLEIGPYVLRLADIWRNAAENVK